MNIVLVGMIGHTAALDATGELLFCFKLAIVWVLWGIMCQRGEANMEELGGEWDEGT